MHIKKLGIYLDNCNKGYTNIFFLYPYNNYFPLLKKFCTINQFLRPICIDNNKKLYYTFEKNKLHVRNLLTKRDENEVDNNNNNNNITPLFNDKLIIDKELNSNKMFSHYTKCYIQKESEHILVLCLKKLNEYEKIKDKAKLSVFIYELQNLSKSKISFNILKNIDIINKLFIHINENIQHASSPSLLLSVALSYRNIKLNKYTYFKNVLRAVCNNIKVYKTTKLNKLLRNENNNNNNNNNKESYEYTIELLNKNKKKNKSKQINMLNVYTNNMNNSTLCYILYSYSTLFTISNSYLLYISKYILLNPGNLNYLDILSLLYFLSRNNLKIKKNDLLYYKDIQLNNINKNTTTNTSIDKNEIKISTQDDSYSLCKHKTNVNDTKKNKIIINDISSLKNINNKYDEYKNTYMKILRTIIYIISKRKMLFENPNILILILYYYFKLNLIPIQIFYKLHFKIKKNIKNIDIKYVSLYLYILSNINFNISYYKFIYKYLTNVFQYRQKEFNILSLSMSFYSLSKNFYFNDQFINVCLNLFLRNAKGLNDILITNIIYTLGKLKIKNDELCDTLCDILSGRMESMSILNLSLIVHNLSKLNYKNENFYKLCLEKGKELFPIFTAKQLVIFTEGMIMNNIYDYEFIEMFFNKLIKIDNIENKKKTNILNKICFSLILEKQDFIKRFPLSINTMISKHMDYIQKKSFMSIHDEIVNILNYLNVENFEILKEKKPYMFDIYIRNNDSIYIDILSPKEYLNVKKLDVSNNHDNNNNNDNNDNNNDNNDNNNDNDNDNNNNNNYYYYYKDKQLSAFIELKKRHMSKLNAKYLYFDKTSYLSLDSIDKKIKFIKTFLEKKCSYNFNYINKTKEQQKKDISTLLLFNETQTNYYQNKIEQQTKFIKDKDIMSRYHKKYPIKNKDFYLFLSCAKTENIIKNYHKKKKIKVNYKEPLIKQQQIFVNCDEKLLLHENKTELFKNTFTEYSKGMISKENNPFYNQYDKERKFLFHKKCHGLSKYEYIDEKTNKIVIKKMS
ncbi:hypothetical protein PFMC_01463 [Plasmodium falciparum CAMP/Malaysia]|uniref:Uncharacterized protein n=1 Tax=Plasmodium falciparum (isolate Camp / Malaysia) TaxID=5835 RepID=A0A024XAV8_PLAFC|nr:hypothetical protein PFMC_01463 [Plasmodium falciparum CAMP/Malaysia]